MWWATEASLASSYLDGWDAIEPERVLALVESMRARADL